MRRVIIESPYAGDVAANVAYARRCLHDALLCGEAPLASHLLYTQDGVLRDDVVAERALGIAAGLAWRAVADASVFYTDRGWSPDMLAALESATAARLTVALRALDGVAQLPPDHDLRCRRLRHAVQDSGDAK